MKVLLLCYLQIAFTVAGEYYDRRYDMFDVDFLVQNPRLLKKYIDCFLDKGPCSPIGRVFKSILPEIIETACAKCTVAQKSFARRAFNAFAIYLPDSYNELRRQLDPDDKYYAKFEAAVGDA